MAGLACVMSQGLSKVGSAWAMDQESTIKSSAS